MIRNQQMLRLFVVSLTLSLAADGVRGQETTADTAAPNAAAQAKAAFEQKFDEYKAAIRDIEKLNAEYQAADAAAREKINVRLTGQLAHTQSLVNGLVEAATEAYRFAPNSDPRITDLLLAVVQYEVAGRERRDRPGTIEGGDQYERALPTIKVLVDGGVENRDLVLWGFLCAFVAHDYDLAEQYLEKVPQTPPAKEEAGADDAAKQETMGLIAKFAPAIDTYRTLWAQESALRAAEAAADDLPRVKLTTTKGEITLELFENEAPQTVANFLTLVKQGNYNGLPFHRVIAKFMAQGGAKNDDGTGRLGYSIRGEASQLNHRHHFRGSLSMGLLPGLPDSGGGQFFLTAVPTSHLDGQHTVFGRVIEGIEVLADLARREPDPDPAKNAALPEPDRILKAEVLRDRGHDYSFEKLPEP